MCFPLPKMAVDAKGRRINVTPRKSNKNVYFKVFIPSQETHHELRNQNPDQLHPLVPYHATPRQDHVIDIRRRCLLWQFHLCRRRRRRPLLGPYDEIYKCINV